jgi:hypothetical protein
MEGQAEKQPAETVDLDGIAGLIDSPDADADAEGLEGDQKSDGEQGNDPDAVAQAEDDNQDGDPSDDDNPNDDPDDATEILTHEGKEVHLKKSEVLELAQKGFDYTKKTMALAEERKALEPVKQQYQERLTQHEQALTETMHRLQTAADFLESELGQPPSTDLASYDAGAYIAQKEAYQARVDKLRNTYGQLQHLEQQQNQLRQSQLLEKANETEKYLVEHLPGWKDAPEKSLAELNSYIKEFGLSPETTKEAYVERGLWEIAHKAREYDRLMAQKATLKPKAELPKVNKPAANHNPTNVRQQEALKRFNKKPSLETLADLI